MVKAQETRRLPANTATEPQEPLSPSQSCGSLEELCPYPLSVNPLGGGTQAPGQCGFCSPILGEGPGTGVTQAQEDKAATCHISSEPRASIRWGGGWFPKGPPISGVPSACSDQDGGTGDFWSQNNRSSTTRSLCDTGPITDGPAHAAGAQERTKDLLTRGTGGIWTETQRGQAGGIRASLPWGQSFSLEA